MAIPDDSTIQNHRRDHDPPPQLPPNYLPRPRLDDVVRESMEHPITVVSGPAGSGKTTAVAAVGAAAHPVTWVTLDDTDRRPTDLIAHLSAALSDGATTGATRNAHRRGDLSHLHATLDRVGATGHHRVLVIDDALEPPNRQAARVLDLLLRRPSCPIRLVVITRDSSRWSLHRQRARGEVAEVTAEDLRFTPAEVEAYLGARGGWAARAKGSELVTRVEGWPALLHLVAQEAANTRLSVNRWIHSAEELVDGYVRAVVLADLGGRDQQFLRDTSMCEILRPRQCDALSGHADSQAVLTGLTRRGLLRRVSDPEGWRPHPMVRRVAHGELQTSQPSRAARLRGRAFSWLASHGELDAALDVLINDNRSEDVHAWLSDAIRDSNVAVSPGKLHRLVETAMTYGLGEDADAAAKLVDAAIGHADRESLEDLLVGLERPTDRPDLHDLAMQCRHAIARFRGDGVEVLRQFPSVDAVVGLATGAALAGDGRHDLAAGHLEEAIRRAIRSNESRCELLGVADLAWERAMAGYLGEADLLARRAGRSARQLGLSASPLTARLAMAQIAFDRGRLEKAADDARRVSESSSAKADAMAWTEASLLEARIQVARGRPTDASRVIDMTHEHLVEHNAAGDLLWRVTRAQIGLRLHLKDASIGGVVSDLLAASPEQLQPRDMMLVARLHAFQGRLDRAASLCRELVRAALGPRLTMHSLVLLSGTARQRQDPATASRSRQQALRLAQTYGLVASLRLGRAGGAFGSTSTVEADSRSSGRSRTGSGPDFEDLLTGREFEVFQLLPSRLSNREIASELCVSVNTVKTHIQSVYLKLNVHSRRGAVDRGRQLGLLSHDCSCSC